MQNLILNLQNSSIYSFGRFLNDISGPLLFILKVSVFRALFFYNISVLNIHKLSKALLYLSMAQVIIFLYFSAKTGAYAGITLPVNIPAALYISSFNYVSLGVVVCLIVLSGKRSFLISVAAVSALAIFVRGSHRNRSAFLILLAILTAAIILFGNDKIFNTVSAANDLLELTNNSLLDFDSDQMRSGLYLLTAGRSEELYSILGEMNLRSWIIGLGPGFTYSIVHADGIIDGYANAHFSPLSLTYKFGVIYAFVFYCYIMAVIVSLFRSRGSKSLFIGSALLIYSLQSLFAFNFFADPYFPIILGLGMGILRIDKIKMQRAKLDNVVTKLVGRN